VCSKLGIGSLGRSSWAAKVIPSLRGMSLLLEGGVVCVECSCAAEVIFGRSGTERGTDAEPPPARVSPKDLGIEKIRTWVGILSVRGCRVKHIRGRQRCLYSSRVGLCGRSNGNLEGNKMASHYSCANCGFGIGEGVRVSTCKCKAAWPVMS